MAKKLTDDILRWTLEINGKPAQKQLSMLEKNTYDLQKANKALGTEMAKLEAQGKRNSEEWKALDKKFKENQRTINQSEAQMKQLRSEIGIGGMTIRQLRKHINDLNQQKLDAPPAQIRKLNKELDAAKARMGQLSGSMSGTGKIMGLLGKVLPIMGFAALAAGARKLVSDVISVRSEFERYYAVLKSSLGDAQQARMEMGMLKDFAEKTPFQLDELTGSYVKLVNQGFKPSQEEMRKLGDLASYTGKGFDQLTEAIIDAQVGEFERLKEFGIRAQKHGDQVRFTFKEVSTEVDFTAKSIQKYILGLGELQGVSGSMAEISKTLGGRISNLKDSWDSFLNTLGGKTNGIFAAVISWMSSFVKWVEEATYSVKQIKEMVLDDLTKQNMESSVEEINVMTKSLVRNGIEAKKAEERALKLWMDGRDQQIKTLKEQHQTASSADQVHLQSRITLLEAERTAVKLHYNELKKLESEKGGGKESSDKLLSQIEKKHQERLLIIEKAYYNEQSSKEKHDNDLLVEELIYSREVIALKKKLGESVVDLELQYQQKINEIKEKRLDFEKNFIKSIYDYAEEVQEESDKFIENLFKTEGEKSAQEQEVINRVFDASQRIREEQRKNESEADDKAREQRIRNIDEWSDATLQAIDTIQMFNEAAMNRELAAAGSNTKKKEEIERKYRQKQQQWAITDAVITGIIEIAKIWANPASVANPVYGAIMTAIAAARTAGSVALISSQGFTKGGYTGAGAWQEPKGVVHANEWVGNRFAVQNPNVRQFLDVFDMAQRSGRIGRLNTQAILAAVETRRGGYSAGGYSQTTLQGAAPVASLDPELKIIMAQNLRMISTLNERLKYPLEADISYQRWKKRMDEMDNITRSVTMT